MRPVLLVRCPNYQDVAGTKAAGGPLEQAFRADRAHADAFT